MFVGLIPIFLSVPEIYHTHIHTQSGISLQEVCVCVELCLFNPGEAA